ncbi:MAG: carboxypeptidase-like regulatory domain-containing protein [Bacteroidetes bacterium]|nr:carboxypeptidase-like regulatory domain-containing protein [Bacteroidota bacterium]
MKTCSINILLFFLLLPLFLAAQHLKFHGTIVNEETGNPVENVNLVIRNSKSGTATNQAGAFELALPKLPVLLDITCVGYKPLTVEVGEIVKKPVVIRLKPQVRQLESVTITKLKATAVYTDPDYSVLDYELMGDNLLILVFRYQLKRSAMLLLNPDGDTLAQVPLPELPPDKLFRDAFGNVHYFSKKGNAFQCHYDPSLNHLYFPYRTTVDSINRMLGNFSFSMKKRLYFQEDISQGFRAKIGYYDMDQGVKYLQTVQNERSESDYYRDKYFFISPSRLGDTIPSDFHEQAYDFFARGKNRSRMVKIGNERVAVFNFGGNVIDIVDADWNLEKEVPISFHKEHEYAFLAALANSFFPDDTWKWSGKLLTDEPFGEVYTSFRLHDEVRLSKIDIESGVLTNEFVIPFSFPEKIQVHRGYCYFLYKECGQEPKRKLYRMKFSK